MAGTLEDTVPPKVAAAFQKLDLEGDGKVDKKEMTSVLQELDPATFSDAVVNRLMEAADIEHTGRIQLHEFLEWIFTAGQDQRLLCDSMGLVADEGEQELETCGGATGEEMEASELNMYRAKPVEPIPCVPVSGYVGSLAKKATVSELREVIGKAIGVPAISLSLASDGQDLDCTKTLKENGVLEPGAAARRRGARIDISFHVDPAQIAAIAKRLQPAVAREATSEEPTLQTSADTVVNRPQPQPQPQPQPRRAEEEGANIGEVQQMATVGFRRLMSEFRKVQRALRGKELPWVLQCEPIEDNMLHWNVVMNFPPESPLQQSLANLAESVFDAMRDRLTLHVRFPPEYPRAPPEVWLRQPRLKYRSEVPVTFGGKVCNQLLTSAGWNPASSVSDILLEIRHALLESGAEVDMAVSIKRMNPYLESPPELTRLRTERFPLANSFVKEGLTVLSTREAGPFMGDLSKLEASDKIGLPFEFAEELYGRAARGETLELPLMFEVKTQLGRKTHCAIYDFLQGLPQDMCLLPTWVMEELSIENRMQVRVRSVALSLIKFVKVQPHSMEFYEAVRDSGQEVGPLLTQSLARFSALTEDTCVPIEIGEDMHKVQIVELKPDAAVRIIDTDVQHHFQFEVDFEASPDLEDDDARKEREMELRKRAASREEAKAAEQRKVAQQVADAQRSRFETLCHSVFQAAGSNDGLEGDVEVALRLPDGTQVRGKFTEGAPVAAIMAIALRSQWAQMHTPWGLHLMIPFPRRLLQVEGSIQKDLHRAAISVQEEREPADADEILQLSASAEEPQLDALEQSATLLVPELDEEAARRRTEEAFEIQRFVQEGATPEEARQRIEAGERLGLTDAQRAAAATDRPRSPLAVRRVEPIPQPPLEQLRSDAEQREEQVQMVMNVTGASHEQSRETLELSEWNTEQAVNILLDALDD